jgi:hypothetical protein
MDFCVVGVPEKGVLVQDFLDSLTVPDYAPGYDPIGESRQREKVFLTARKEVGHIMRLHTFIHSLMVGWLPIMGFRCVAGEGRNIPNFRLRALHPCLLFVDCGDSAGADCERERHRKGTV